VPQATFRQCHGGKKGEYGKNYEHLVLVGTIFAVKNTHWGGVGVNVLAWVLMLVGLLLSPALLAVLGFGLTSTG